MELTIIIAIFVLVAVIIFVCVLFEKKRTKAFEELAVSLNFTFTKRGSDALLAELGSFDLFSRGHAKKLKNVMKGSANNVDVTIADYQYTTGGGKNSHTWSQTLIAFKTDLLALTSFTLRPETLFHKMGSAFGYQDIDFDAHPVFSKQYLLRGDNEDAIRELFRPEVLDYYEQHKGLSTEGSGKRLIFYRASRRVSPKDTKAFMEEGFRLFTLFKTE
jgi:hypothetical protein